MALPANTIYIDFETYYDTDYSLRSLTAKQYVTDPRFKVHGCSVAVGDDEPIWLNEQQADWFFKNQDISGYAAVMHNALFDGTVLTHHYGVRPRLWVDTLGMARAVIGTRLKSLSLDSVGKSLGVGGKLDDGRALQAVKGVRDPSPEQMALLATYANDDVKITRSIAKLMAALFPEGEYQLLSWTIDMGVMPRILIDPAPLDQLRAEEEALKNELLAKTGLPKTHLSSNPKFADVLRSVGIEPPVKTSRTTGKETYAFAKSDEAFIDLLDHPDDVVHDLVAARLAVKSTIKESRAAKLKELSANGPLPVILNYSGAQQTHRLSGGGGINVQNFTRRSLLRKALVAPDGMVFVVADLSQIELRGNALASGQTNILDTLQQPDGDVYLNFAKDIYNDQTLTKDDNPDERTVGKIGELSLGYYSGAAVFKAMLRAMARIRIDEAEAKRIVRLYRSTHQMIAAAWRIYGSWIEIMARGEVPYMDNPINLPITLRSDGFILPSGLEVSYPGITRYDFTAQQPLGLYDTAPQMNQVGYAYRNERKPGGFAKLHAGVLNNNLIQSVCRDVNFDSTKTILDGIRDYDPTASVVMSVHDETVALAREDRAEAVLDFMLSVLKTRPSFWPDLPVDAEGSIGKTYGDAK